MIISSASSRETGKSLKVAVETLHFAVLALGPADEIVGGAAGKILHRLDALLAEHFEHGGGEAGNLVEFVGNAEHLAGFIVLTLDGRQVLDGAVLDFTRRLLVEPLDRGDFGEVDIGQLLDRGEAFRSQ